MPEDREPSTQHSVSVRNILVLMLLGVILFGLGTVFGESRTKPVQTQAPKVTSVSPTPIKDPLSSMILDISVKTVPLNAHLLKKSIIITDTNYSALGLVFYEDEKTKQRIYINSLQNTKLTEGQKQGLSEIATFLKGGTIETKKDLNPWLSPFRYGWGGASNIFLREVPGITYPNTDAAKVIINHVTQEAFGEVTIFIYAKKGDDIIMISKMLSDEKLYKASGDACYINQEMDGKCYREKISTDPAIYQAAATEARKLITNFPLR